MNSNTFVKWLFSPKGSGVITDPDLSSPSPSKSHPASTSNAPSHPNQVAENDVNEELKRVILQESCLIKLDRGSNCEAENGTIGVAGEQAEGENGSWGETEKEEKYNKEETCGGSVEIDTKYPVRPDAEDCAYYMKTGTCKFGSGCCFNHPSAVPRKVQAGIYESDHGEAAKHYVWQVECKYYLSPGGCKWGKACKFSHWSTTEFNFLGLPIRPGEKECMYFMRTGTCKYAATCRFNHPDPTSTDGGDRDKLKPPVEYSNSSSRLGSPPPPSPPQFPASAIPWSSPAEAMMYSSSPTQSPKPEWNNGCQFPVNQAAAAGQSSSKIAPSPLYILHNWTAENHTIYTNQHQMEMNDYPERPGQPECTYFMKSGDCKFKSNCKFHHPKERISKSPHHANNHGFRLGTDPSICVHYRRYGICRFGPSCKFNHPVNIDDPSRSRRIDHQQSSPSRTTGDSVSAWPSSRPHVISL